MTTRARRLLGWALGAVIVIALLVTLDAAAIGEILVAASPALVVLGVVGLTAVHVIGAATWRALTARLGGIVLRWRSAMQLYYAGQALGGLTPANLGSDAYRAAVLRPAAESRTATVFPIVAQRAASYLALSLVGLVSLVVVSVPADIPAAAIIFIVAITGLLVGGAGAAWLARHPGAMPAVGRAALARAIAIGLLGGLSFHLVAIGFGYILVLAVEPAVVSVAPAVLASIAIARLSLLLPLVPSGLGIGEAALAVLFTGIGLSPESALAASLLARLGLVLTTVVGSVALATTGGTVHWATPWPSTSESRVR